MITTTADKFCHVCGKTSNDEASHCRQCAVPAEIAASLPPFPDLLETEIPSLNRWNAAQLKTHPGAPWSPNLPAGEPKIITAKTINYKDVLDENTSLFLWCSPDQTTLYIREIMQQQCEDRWLTISGRVCRYGQLQTGDLLTIGSYPWVFHTYSRGQGFGLEPANPFVGSTIRMHDVHVGRRLSIPELRFTSGSFVGIIGASGSGKSTMIREIVETRAGRGEVSIDGHCRDALPDPAVQRVAYVPQMDVIYDDMTVIQQTVDYVRLVHPKAKQSMIDESLRVVGLRNLVHRLPSQLSGGQVRRMRLAAALARRPGVLLLDEPDSGLDPETALSVQRLLRTISLLGTTVITVTHHRHGMERFDRVLTLDQGRIVADSRSDAIMDNPKLVDAVESLSSTTNSWKQFSQVFLREWVQFKQRKFFTIEHPILISLPQWLLVGVLIPILFGLGIAIASPIKDFQPHLVGFLCVLSVIWMSASHSHLALTTNWYRTQYERWQGLQAYPLIAAKSAFLAAVATIQTCLFFAVLWVTRYIYLERPIFYGSLREDHGLETVQLGHQHFAKMDQNVWGVLLTLFVVGIAASQLGLLISVVAKWRTLVAASILPLVMITQILFSPFVVQATKSDRVPEETYAGFWWQRDCEGNADCPSELLVYRPPHGFICKGCSKPLDSKELTTTPLTEWELNERKKENDDVPIALATAASYWTLTRYADLTLRPIIRASEGELHEQSYGYTSLRSCGMMSLIGIAIACHGLVSLLFGCVSPQSILRKLRVFVMKKS